MNFVWRAYLEPISLGEEPENLSLKPEDRYAAAEKERKRLRALLEAPVVSSTSPPPAHQPVKSWTPPCLTSATAYSSGEVKLATPLEPLDLNNQSGSLYNNNNSNGSSRSSALSISVLYQSYTPYLPFNFPYRSCWPRESSTAASATVPLYPVTPQQNSPNRHEQLSPFAPSDSMTPPHLSPTTTPILATDLNRKWMAAADPESANKLCDSSDICDLSSPASGSNSSSESGAETTTTTATAPRKKNSSSSARYQCPDCHKSYSTYCGLTKHQELHCVQQAKKSFSCKHCDKVYVSLGALKMHIRTHTLPCKCMLCGKAFSRPWLLQGHIRTHTGEKPFSCPHCSRSFADRSNLRAHLQTHSDVKRYSCKACGKTFSRMSLLSKHEDGGCPGVLIKRDVA